jgi:hypothetical protein
LNLPQQFASRNHIAIVEYTGLFPREGKPHGNSKHTSQEYIRTDPKTLTLCLIAIHFTLLDCPFQSVVRHKDKVGFICSTTMSVPRTTIICKSANVNKSIEHERDNVPYAYHLVNGPNLNAKEMLASIDYLALNIWMYRTESE